MNTQSHVPDQPTDLEGQQLRLRERLFAAGLLIPTGVDGLYGRSAEFERLLDAVDRAICVLGADEEAVAVEYPPVLPRATFDRTGYLRNFPQLAGVVHSFSGGEREHADLVRRLDAGDPVDAELAATEVALTPACCYPIYPSLTGRLDVARIVYVLRSYCFRHEPSVDPMRLQAFRQREHVCVGVLDSVLDWRELWLERCSRFLHSIGLAVSTDVANDPFFGRGGRLMSVSQREQRLKMEFSISGFGLDSSTACASVNFHQDGFGTLFDIRAGDGYAYSACVGFGLERTMIALLGTHGFDIGEWPAEVTQVLGL